MDLLIKHVMSLIPKSMDIMATRGSRLYYNDFDDSYKKSYSFQKARRGRRGEGERGGEVVIEIKTTETRIQKYKVKIKSRQLKTRHKKKM